MAGKISIPRSYCKELDPLCATVSRAPNAWIAHGSYEPEAPASEWMVPSYESEGGIHSLALRARIQVDAVIVCNPSVRRPNFYVSRWLRRLIHQWPRMTWQWADWMHFGLTPYRSTSFRIHPG